jgi:hypothetical protein
MTMLDGLQGGSSGQQQREAKPVPAGGDSGGFGPDLDDEIPF